MIVYKVSQLRFKNTLNFLSIIVLIIIYSCSGKDGNSGNAYLSLNWVYAPTYYYDENSDTPSIIYNGEYFKSEPDSYYFRYTAWNGSRWSGYYTLTVNPGGSGSTKMFIFPEDGRNGADKYFDLDLYSSGPTLYSSRESASREIARNANQATTSISSIEKISDKSTIKHKNTNTTKFSETKTIGNMTMRIEYWRLNAVVP